MPIPEDRLELVESTLNKAYSDIKRELTVTQGYTEDAVKRLVGQKIILDDHAQILSDHTARLDRIETMLAQILTHLRETPSASSSDPEPTQPEPVRQRRERTFWERAFGGFPDETEVEKP